MFGMSLGNQFTNDYVYTNLPIRTDVKHLIMNVWNFYNLVVYGYCGHGITCPDTNVLILLEVGIFLHHFDNITPTVIQLFHLIQFPKTIESSAAFIIILVLDQLYNVLVDSIVLT